MRTSMRARASRATLGCALAVGMLCAMGAGPASATTLSPAGHSIDFGTQQVDILQNGGAYITCTMDGGAATIPAAPANHVASGPLTVALSTRPSFSSCLWFGSPVTVTSAGSWSVSVENGAPPKFTLKVPQNGLYFPIPGCMPGVPYNTGFSSTGGTWLNGTVAPLVVSTAKFGNVANMPSNPNGAFCQGANLWTLSGKNNSMTASDTTNPAAVITVTP